MKNPLEQFVSVEERIDGMYVKVTRAERDSLQLDVVLRTMANSIVMNFNGELFKDVFSRARGAYEKIGPIFEFSNNNHCSTSNFSEGAVGINCPVFSAKYIKIALGSKRATNDFLALSLSIIIGKLW